MPVCEHPGPGPRPERGLLSSESAALCDGRQRVPGGVPVLPEPPGVRLHRGEVPPRPPEADERAALLNPRAVL